MPKPLFSPFFRTFAYQDGFIGCGIPFLPLESFSAFRSFSLGGNSRVRRVRASVQEETNTLGRSWFFIFCISFSSICMCMGWFILTHRQSSVQWAQMSIQEETTFHLYFYLSGGKNFSSFICNLLYFLIFLSVLLYHRVRRVRASIQEETTFLVFGNFALTLTLR